MWSSGKGRKVQVNKGKTLCCLCVQNRRPFGKDSWTFHLEESYPRLPVPQKRDCGSLLKYQRRCWNLVVDCFTLFQLNRSVTRAVKFPSANCWRCCIKFLSFRSRCWLPIFICKNSWQLQACVTTDLSKCGKSTPSHIFPPEKNWGSLNYLRSKSSGNQTWCDFPMVFWGLLKFWVPWLISPSILSSMFPFPPGSSWFHLVSPKMS